MGEKTLAEELANTETDGDNTAREHTREAGIHSPSWKWSVCAGL